MNHCTMCHRIYPDDIEASACCRRLHGWLPEVSVTYEVLISGNIVEISRHARVLGVR